MRQQRCKPDLSAYTHMITAHNKAGQWRTSLQLFEQMQQANCRPDVLVYSLVVDVLWNTGIASAQAKAVQVSFKAHSHGVHAKDPAECCMQRRWGSSGGCQWPAVHNLSPQAGPGT